MGAVVPVVDHGAPVDLIHYVAARARLDAAIAEWNQRTTISPPTSPR